MNRIKLLKLHTDGRRKYIRNEMSDLPIQTLRHYAAEYGVQNSSLMGREELLEQITVGLENWANAEALQ